MRKFFAVSFFAVMLGTFVMSCGNPVDDDRKPDDSTGAVRIAVITTASDYSAAGFEIISADDYSVTSNLIPELGSDIQSIRAFGAGVYIVESFGSDKIVKYDSKIGAVVYEQPVGTGLNIQDIAVVSETKAYISALESSDLRVFNPATGTVTSTIDLSQFNTFAGTDSAEAYPFMKSLAYHNGYLYVACQRLRIVEMGGWSAMLPGDTSLIVVIDVAVDEVVGNIPLNKKNPASMSVFGNYMLVASSGSWMDIGGNDAGVEKINLAERENLGVIAEGSALGGNPDEVIFISANSAYVSVMGDDWTAALIPFDPSAGTIGATINEIQDASGFAYDGVKLYVGERGFGTAGVAIINPSTNNVERKIDTGMPPLSLAVIFAD